MGIITVSGQIETFFYAVLLGISYCLLYDVFRCFHIKVFKGYWSIFFSDILYWIILFISTYSFLLLFCNGSVRVYVLLGNTLGFVICRYTVSWIFIKFCFLIAYIIRQIISLICMPFYMLLSFMSKLYEKVVAFFKKIVKNLSQKKKKHLERDVVNSV